MNENNTNFKEFNKIFVLVSGGIDSTYLYELFKKEELKRNKYHFKHQVNLFNLPFELLYHSKIYPTNCFNPYETSHALTQISRDKNYIQITPGKKYNYGEILRESFLKLPEARKLKKNKRYFKQVFPCCYYIKHKSFLNDPQFKEPNTVVISGIKAGDGQRRGLFLRELRLGYRKISHSKNDNCYDNGNSTFFHRHRGGQLYCYPFRDYRKRELPDIIIKRLRIKYPTLDHSGCYLCPVLVLFNLKYTKNFKRSYEYAHKLGVLENQLLTEWL